MWILRRSIMEMGIGFRGSPGNCPLTIPYYAAADFFDWGGKEWTHDRASATSLKNAIIIAVGAVVAFLLYSNLYPLRSLWFQPFFLHLAEELEPWGHKASHHRGLLFFCIFLAFIFFGIFARARNQTHLQVASHFNGTFTH